MKFFCDLFVVTNFLKQQCGMFIVLVFSGVGLLVVVTNLLFYCSCNY